MPLIAIKPNNDVKVIDLPNDFVSLTRKGRDIYELGLTFYFSLPKVKQSNAFKVRIQSFQGRKNKLDENTSSLINNDSIVDTREAMNRISTGLIRSSKLNFSTTVDLTTVINNSLANTNGEKTSLKVKNYSDSLVAEKDRIEAETPEESKYNYKPFISTIYSNYILSGIDPTEKISESFKQHIITDKFSGTVVKQYKNDDPLINVISSYFKRDNPEKKLSQVISLESTEWLTFKKSINISRSDLEVNGWYFYFEVINKQNNVIQTIEKNFNVGDLLQLATTPLKSPKIRGAITNIRGINYCSFTSYGSSDTLSDLNLSTVTKDISPLTSATTHTTKNLTLTYPLIGSHVFGRTYYSSNGIMGNDFSSAVVVDKRYRSSGGCVIATQLGPGDFKILATNLHPRAVSVIFYHRDLTNKRKSAWQNLSNQEKVNENNEAILIFDSGIPGHTYEFYAEIYLNDGTKIDTKSDIVESYPSSNINLVTQITNFLIDQSNNDVTFSIDFSIPDNSIDTIVKLLENSGYQDYFNDKTQDQITQIKKFIGFSIFRFNIDQGVREYLGSMLVGSFSDKFQSEMLGIDSYNENTSYQYEIFPSIIDPISMYENQIEKIYSADLTKNHIANNTKFKSLLTKKHSTIFSSEGLKNKFSTTLLNNNVIGYSTVYVVKKTTNSIIENLHISNSTIISNECYNTITWNCESKESVKIDYFLINRCCNGRQINNVGKILFSQQLNGEFNFIDKVDILGNITYQVLPVYNNGIVGTVSTAKIFINDNGDK